MFGLFKKKPSPEEQFVVELGTFAAEFGPVMRQVDPHAEDEMMQRALNNYFNRSAAESGYSAADFYFDAYTGAIFELTMEDIIPPQHSHAVFSLTEKWLQERPRYLSETVDSLMQTWEALLQERGVDTRYALY